MYCKKCNHLLKESSICPNCGFNNDEEVKSNELKEAYVKPKKKNTYMHVIILISIMFIISLVLIVVYSIKDSKKDDTLERLDKTLTTTVFNKTKTFKFDNLILEYPDSFGVATNTIFYKNNSEINISINSIDLETYNQSIELNEHLDSKIGEFNSITYAEDNSYSHLIIDGDKYYLIKVNYVNDRSAYTEEVQLTISNILNSLKKK